LLQLFPALADAPGKPGDRRAGVVWHTQGSGKSFSMLLFAARVVRHPAMQSSSLAGLLS